jgi:TRAP-type mannitol/chloroaromatic compound transport system permease small subunit
MTVQRFLHAIDGISTWVGKASAWLIISLMPVVCTEVFKRYLLNVPTSWIFDGENLLYGTLFMLCGAYTLAQNAHVNQIFGGMMPCMLIVIVCMIIMYAWPGMTLWLPAYLYGG